MSNWFIRRWMHGRSTSFGTTFSAFMSSATKRPQSVWRKVYGGKKYIVVGWTGRNAYIQRQNVRSNAFSRREYYSITARSQLTYCTIYLFIAYVAVTACRPQRNPRNPREKHSARKRGNTERNVRQFTGKRQQLWSCVRCRRRRRRRRLRTN